jgi:SAM-dependent methyltransferase
METDVMHVDPANAEQARAWNGDEGAYWARHPDAFEVSMRAYDQAFFAAADLRPDDRVLDLGCGTGGTTRAAARAATNGSALGVDLSGPMLEVARQRAAEEGLQNLDFLQADAAVHPLEPGSFDVLISRTGAMFFGDPDAAFAALARAVQPGGRMVLLVWQEVAVNEWFTEFVSALAVGRTLPSPPAGAPGPFAFSDPTRLRTLLDRTGWADVTTTGLSAPMYFGPTVDAAYELISGLLGWMLADLDERGRQQALTSLRSSMEAHLGAGGVTFRSGAWLVTARRP